MSFSSFLPINEARYAVKEKDIEDERNRKRERDLPLLD